MLLNDYGYLSEPLLTLAQRNNWKMPRITEYFVQRVKEEVYNDFRVT